MEQANNFKAFKSIVHGASVDSEGAASVLHTDGNGNANPANENLGVGEKPAEVINWKRDILKIAEYRDLRDNLQVVPLNSFRPSAKEKHGQFQEYSMLLRWVYNTKGGVTDYRLEIQSPTLQHIFREKARGYKELDLEASPIIIRHPFQCLVFLREPLEEFFKKEETATTTKTELSHLLSFINSEPTLCKTLAAASELIGRRKITFPLIWTVFPPRELVYVHSNKQDHQNPAFGTCAYIDSCEFEEDQHKKIRFKINVVSGYHNGHRFGLIDYYYFSITEFEGTKSINIEDLGGVPMKYLSEDQQTQIRDTLIRRGRRYHKLCKDPYTLLHYKGPLVIHKSDHSKRLGTIDSYSEQNWSKSLAANTRVVIDKTAEGEFSGVDDSSLSFIAPNIKTYLEAKSERDMDETLNAVPFRDDSSSVSSDIYGVGNSRQPNPLRHLQVQSEISDEDFLICQASSLAFVLEEKIWAGVYLECLTEIEWKEDPFIALQLGQEKKHLIRALVNGFSGGDSTDEFDDIIQGKGRGLIFLLHGNPGIGKTLTAESVAESTHRALYQISTGELTTDISSLEDKLGEVFRLGLRWKAIVLLDEADVLMTERNSSDLQRNAIVATFLRLLEYYNGMLFLTTNRLQSFDKAFQNRIHVTVQYEALSKAARANIWRQHITRACRMNTRRDLWNENFYDTLAELETNGRDIRNLTRTAYGYAKALHEDMRCRHVMMVIRNNDNAISLDGREAIFERLETLENEIDSYIAAPTLNEAGDAETLSAVLSSTNPDV